MTRRQWPTVVALISLLALGVSATSAAAKNAKHDKDKGDRKRVARVEKQPRAVRRQAIVFDRDDHRRLVREYFTHDGLPPGLAKREALPPGLRRQLRERGRLPPGLQKRLEPVPSALVARLPAVPPYYSRYLAGRDLVVIDTRTNRIIAMVRDARP